MRNYGHNNDITCLLTEIPGPIPPNILSHNVCLSNYYKQRINEHDVNNVEDNIFCSMLK